MLLINKLKPVQSTDRVIENLKQFTNARIAIGHSGGYQRTRNWLMFQKDFANAKDAVLKDLDLDQLQNDILTKHPKLTVLQAKSQITSQEQFLTRPDLGRALNIESRQYMSNLVTQYPTYKNKDILIVVSSGLSALAIERQVTPLLKELLDLFELMKWSLAPIIISKLSRVAFADKVNAVFKSKMLINLIGERPGLSSCDSMSIYFTYKPALESTNDARNCISNIHEHGLNNVDASKKLVYLIHKAFLLQTTGVKLKDDFSIDKFSQLTNKNYES